MKTDLSKQGLDVKWQDMALGASVVNAGGSAEFNTGDWRVNTPHFIENKCTQCLLCVPVCPDSSIPVKDGKRLDFDFDHCKGCGICAKVCPFGAIEMREGKK
jgi:pyruvate ferredoxin oxidoreductase delta subunit